VCTAVLVWVVKTLQNMWNWPKFSFESRLLMKSQPSIGWDVKENLVVSKCINQSRFERYAVHRKHPRFPRDPGFRVAVAVSILRVLNVWRERKLTNIPPDSDSELDSNSETLSWRCNFLFQQRIFFGSQHLLSMQWEGFAGERDLSPKCAGPS